jgi:hypothetical protein
LNSVSTGSVKPGRTSPPRSESFSVSTAKASGAVWTATLRFLGSTTQASVVPARKYSFSLRRISPRVLFSLSTSTAKSGTRSGIGLPVNSRFGSFSQRTNATSGARTSFGIKRMVPCSPDTLPRSCSSAKVSRWRMSLAAMDDSS